MPRTNDAGVRGAGQVRAAEERRRIRDEASADTIAVAEMVIGEVAAALIAELRREREAHAKTRLRLAAVQRRQGARR